MITNAVYALLSSFTGLTDLITVDGTVNLWRDTFPPEAKFPGVIYHAVYGESWSDNLSRANLGKTLIQIDCFAESSDLADQIAEQVRLCLQSFDGVSAGIQMACVGVNRYHSFFEEETESAQINVWRVSRDFSIVHSET